MHSKENRAGPGQPEETIEKAPAPGHVKASVQATADGGQPKKSKMRLRMPKSIRNVVFGKKRQENNESKPDCQNDENATDSVSIGCTGKVRNAFKKKSAGKNKRPEDEPHDETLFVSDEYPHKEKLGNIVKNNLVGVGLVDRAAACTFDGEIVVCCPTGFQPTAEQVKEALRIVSADLKVSPIGQSFKVHDAQFCCCELTEGAFFCGKQHEEGTPEGCPKYETPLDGGICVSVTKLHVLFAAYAKAQSSTHHDDVKDMMGEISKVLRDSSL